MHGLLYPYGLPPPSPLPPPLFPAEEYKGRRVAFQTIKIYTSPII